MYLFTNLVLNDAFNLQKLTVIKLYPEMRIIIKTTYLIVIILFVAIGCKDGTKKTEKISKPEATEELNVSGNYVSEDYSKRSEGSDWVAVLVSETEGGKLKISIRSRADRKKPTCTFDAVAYKVDDETYQTQINGKTILFEFTNQELNITSKKEEEENLLYFYCSGGASIAGSYLKINESLDQSQIDKTKFSKVLNLQDVGFNISSVEKNGKNILTVFTFGLKEREYNETFDIDGEEVINAEVEDLNSDGSLELFVFTNDADKNDKSNVYAFSVNNMKSMSRVYFQPTAENNKINNGYKGRDEFSLVENTLSQRFPIYDEGKETGKVRQVSYKIIDGEAMRQLVVDGVTEFDK